MELTKRGKTIKYFCYCVLIAFASLLQNVNGLWFEIGGARCFFLIPVSILIGIDEDEKVSALLGLFAGVVWDMVSAQHYGFNAVFIMIACYITSSLVSFLLRATYWVGVVSSIISSLLYVVVYWLLFVFAKGGDGADQSLLYFYLPCFVYTSVMSLVLNLAIIPMKKRLNEAIV